MKLFLDNPAFSQRGKFVPISTENGSLRNSSRIGSRSGKGSQTFENGFEYSGAFSEDQCHGFGTLSLPDLTTIRGTFVNNRFVSGTITYFNAVSVVCTMKTKQNSSDDFMLRFEILFPSKFSVIGDSKKGGNILKAEIRDQRGEVVASFKGLRVKFPLPSDPSHPEAKYIVITRTWVYEGNLSDKPPIEREKGGSTDTVEFGNEGVQIWTKGLGYLRIVPGKELMSKNLLRIYRNMCVYRETVFRKEENFCSATCFPNGMIFITKESFESGVLLFPKSQGPTLQLGCFLNDVVSFEGFIFVEGHAYKCFLNDLGQFSVLLGQKKVRLEEFMKRNQLRDGI